MSKQEFNMSLDPLKPYYKNRSDRIKIANDIASEVILGDAQKINVKLCELLRDVHQKGMSVVEIYDFLDTYSVSQIEKHVKHECRHSDLGDVSYTECGFMKHKYRHGMTLDELASEYDVPSADIVVKHLKNECDHDTGLDPVNL